MNKRNYYVNELIEIFPQNPGLLGWNRNRGEVIALRLRPAHNPNIFLPFDSVVRTMIHELTHMEVSPHNAQFYKLMDAMLDEYDGMIAKGFNGDQGGGVFDTTTGQRVGTVGNRLIDKNADPEVLRRRALEAAIKRDQLNKIMAPAGGVRLGGGEDGRVLESLLTPRELAAIAAQRRLEDSKWCGTEENGSASSSSSKWFQDAFPSGNGSGGGSSSSSSSADPAAISSNATTNPGKRKAIEVIVIDDSDDDDDIKILDKPKDVKRSKTAAEEKSVADNETESTHWACPLCTGLTEVQWRMCQFCEYIRKM